MVRRGEHRPRKVRALRSAWSRGVVPVIGTVLAAAVAGAGCQGPNSAPAEVPDPGGRILTGGEVTVAETSNPDALDPQLGQKASSVELMFFVYTPLLTYKRVPGNAGTQLIPALARDLPEITDGGKTYTLYLRKGLVYSDGTPVKASDFEHAMKRMFYLASGATSFFSNIEGATEYGTKQDPDADIPGIETDDATGKIVIRLTQPTSTMSYALALTNAAPVPGDTPFKNVSANPAPGVGAFKITEYTPNNQWVLERNERFDVPGLPKARLDKITIKIIDNVELQTQQVITGQLDWMQSAPTPDLLPVIERKYRDRFKATVTGETEFLWLNHRRRPFNDERVRLAAGLALNRAAIPRLYAGLLIPTCNMIPPTIPGHRPIKPCPFGERGDLPRARKLIEEASAKGEQVTVWSQNIPPYNLLGEYVAAQLNRIGLKAKPQLLNPAIYAPTVGNASTRAQIGWFSWAEDFPHPYDFMTLLSKQSISSTDNLNLGYVDVPELNRGIEELNKVSDLSKVVDRWADLDRLAIERKSIIPLGTTPITTFMSERMNFEKCAIFNPVYGSDLTRWCLK
jgi:peptide/nickel transport system substrate-binding protein